MEDEPKRPTSNQSDFDPEDYNAFYSDFVDHLFDNEIPGPLISPHSNRPATPFGVGNKSPDVTTYKPATTPSPQRVSNIQGNAYKFKIKA